MGSTFPSLPTSFFSLFTSLFSLPTFLVFSVNVVSSFPFHASSLWRETAHSWPKIAILAYLGNRKGIWWERFRFFLCSYFPQICHLEQYVRQAVLSRPQLLTSLIQRKKTTYQQQERQHVVSGCLWRHFKNYDQRKIKSLPSNTIVVIGWLLRV